ncbi:hypothetical protein ATE49_14680 [Elizabethkingia miricola]|nr:MULTISPECIES: hypothetical protein [Elizabethkingia]KUG12354.1 hypothetical protein AMC91_08455 [Elizabethkingia miricola]MCL1658648.1 hypothetical protein [Elizabethkingia miricola]OBS13294.1 hypothetical protein ATE49_14680 [Elizabethkingia miricola]OIK44367.1 hypothetical protein BEI02_07660 [Elizabethkingia sp. HvH-WGS333]UIO97489.1 hypothetical protein LYZ41_05225 [Elizabethkingia miricola]
MQFVWKAIVRHLLYQVKRAIVLDEIVITSCYQGTEMAVVVELVMNLQGSVQKEKQVADVSTPNLFSNF